MYSLPSSARARNASRVSAPDRGAYRTPASAPNPNPARNQTKLFPSRSDINTSSHECLTEMVQPPCCKHNYREGCNYAARSEVKPTTSSVVLEDLQARAGSSPV